MKKLLPLIVGGLLAASAAQAAPLAREDAEAMIRERLEHYMNDPASAQLKIARGPMYGSVTTKDDTFTGWLVCAELNGKNRYGGNVGAEPYLFVVHPETRSVDVLPRMTRTFENVDAWRAACFLNPPQLGSAEPGKSPTV